MKNSKLKSIIIILVGIILAYFSVIQFNDTRDFIANGNKTTAIIIYFNEHFDDEDDITMYTPVYEYINEMNDTIEFEDFSSSSSPSYTVGDKVDIIYMPNTDDVKFNTIFGLHGLSIALLIIATLIIYLGYRTFLKTEK